MTMHVTQWLHLEMSRGDPWILPIWTAAEAAVKAGRVRTLGGAFGEIGLHISTRLDILPRITRRIDQETSDLCDATKGCESKYVSTETKQGYAFPVNCDIKFCLIADIDALLFELDSCCQLMRELFQLVRAQVGRPVAGSGAEIRANVTSELRAALGSGSDWWFSWLDKQRNFVAHEGTPCLAIDLTDGRRDLLVMKENLTTFVDTNKFSRSSELIEFVRGFIGLREALQAHLIVLFEQSGRP